MISTLLDVVVNLPVEVTLVECLYVLWRVPPGDLHGNLIIFIKVYASVHRDKDTLLILGRSGRDVDLAGLACRSVEREREGGRGGRGGDA